MKVKFQAYNNFFTTYFLNFSDEKNPALEKKSSVKTAK